MTNSDRQAEYIASKVLTAPPHKLHLMLIEGAIRFGRRAEAALKQGDSASASAPLMRVLEIVGEMLVGVRESKSDLNQQLAELYLFVFRRVSEAKVNDDVDKLVEALELLEFERETWQLACQNQQSDEVDQAAPADDRPGNATPHLPGTSSGATAWPPTSTFGFSLEA